jgi:hypothetical protein
LLLDSELPTGTLFTSIQNQCYKSHIKFIVRSGQLIWVAKKVLVLVGCFFLQLGFVLGLFLLRLDCVGIWLNDGGEVII